MKPDMTTLHRIELTCPICGNHFGSQAVASTNSFGGKRTDFHEHAAGMQPLAFLIHMCACCGYAGSERDFGEGADVSLEIRERVWDELAPRLVPGGLPGSEKYEAAARIAAWQGAEPRLTGDLFLRAAWCCVDEGDAEAERFFRRHAAWMLERALASYDGVMGEERAVLTYLVGELWRRIGDSARAHEWFDRVESEIVEPANQQWVVDAALQQRDRPREWFG